MKPRSSELDLSDNGTRLLKLKICMHQGFAQYSRYHPLQGSGMALLKPTTARRDVNNVLCRVGLPKVCITTRRRGAKVDFRSFS